MHPSLRDLKHSNFGSWEVVFKAPEDERWAIVKDVYGAHGLQHNCDIDMPNLRYMDNGACSFCGDEPPESLEGFLKLVEWEK